VVPPANPATGTLAITNTAPASYQWDVLGVGKAAHVDVSEVLTAVPGEYRGLKFLRTANADRFLSAANAISFQTNRDVTVLVAYDTKAATRPMWLANWTDTGDILTTSAGTYRLLRKVFASGGVTLGGNELGVDSYVVVVDDGSALGNTGPTISGTAASESAATREYLFLPSASDGDGDTLTFSATNLPTWATLNPETGALAGTPAASHVGTYTGIVIIASDGSATAALPAFAITVTETPRPTSPPPQADPPPTDPPRPAIPASNSALQIGGTPAATVRQDQSFSFTPAASDPDGNQLTFSISNRPAWANFNAATGRLSGTPSPSDVGTYSGIVIGVSNGVASRSLTTFTITVTPAGTGSATLSWMPPTQNTDGSPLTNLAGYKIYWGRSPQSYANSVTLHNPGLATYVVEQLASGRWYFATTSVNSAGVESGYSNEGSKTIP